MSENMDSLLSTKKQGIFIKNKNYKKLSQKFTKIIFCATKIVVNGSKLSKIIFFERNTHTPSGKATKILKNQVLYLVFVTKECSPLH